MNISGILVVIRPDALEAGLQALEAQPGVDVHHLDRDTGRIVVTLEAASIEDEVAGLKRIKALPGVSLAEMVYHYFGEQGHGRPPGPAAAAVPHYLND